MGLCQRWFVVLVLLFLAAGCASTDSGATPPTAETTSTSSTRAPQPSTGNVESGASAPTQNNESGSVDHATTFKAEALSLLAADIEADPGCVQDRFIGVEAADLEAAGIRPTGIALQMWDDVIADADNPVQDPLMLTVSLCTGFFEELVYEDLADQLPPEELDCIISLGKDNPDIVALHMAGTRNGADFEDAYPEAMVAKLERGQIARYEILANIRTLGECPINPSA